MEKAMRNTRRLFMILSSIVLSGVLGAPTTQATDDKVFPASMCIRIFGSGGNPIYFGDARLFNSSTQPLTVICPIVRDSTLSPWTRIEVIAIDQHFQQNVSCRGHHLNRDGTSDFATAPTSTSFITGITGQVLIIAPAPVDIDKGSFLVRCDIPPTDIGGSSGLASYFIAEP
jgi:hypothetical protein